MYKYMFIGLLVLIFSFLGICFAEDNSYSNFNSDNSISMEKIQKWEKNDNYIIMFSYNQNLDKIKIHRLDKEKDKIETYGPYNINEETHKTIIRKD